MTWMLSSAQLAAVGKKGEKGNYNKTQVYEIQGWDECQKLP